MAGNTKSLRKAVAYYRTSSAANVGPDKDSQRRQREAVESYAKAQKLEIVESVYDAAVSGADPIDERPGFLALIELCKANGFQAILVENASRFARDLAVQLTGHAMLQKLGIELIPVDAPTHFTDPTPTAEMVRQILGAVSQFQKANLVLNLRHAREHVRKAKGRCEGRKAVPNVVVAMAKSLARAQNGKRPMSLRAISAALKEAGHTVIGKGGESTTNAYHPESIKLMLARPAPATPN